MAAGPTDRRPVPVLENISWGELRGLPTKAQQDLDRMNPDRNDGFGVAKVVNIDYEGFFVTLRTVLGTSRTFERVPVPMTFPGAGARHFLGALPQIGDYCVVGWMPQETSEPDGGTKTPVIVNWILPGVWAGRDWVTTADFEVDEYDLDAPRDRAMFEGTHERIRHKLRHLAPGNVVGSSAQGADLVLDEGVLLANRRGNEFRLRDQDQAAVLRALQEFHALAGARIYAGMVQRDASFLAAAMVSDGRVWDDGLQALHGTPLTEQELPADSKAPAGFLTPANILRRGATGADEGYLGRALIGDDSYLDPYVFLRLGGYINEYGYAVDDTATGSASDATYGGKPIYRVALQSQANATNDPDRRTLTEYRIELTHTSDGSLPVTEQTDLFDADRLPEQDQNVPPGTLPVNAPFLEWVMGSVVGNDLISPVGRKKYALPLRAVIFDGDVAAPRLEAAHIVAEGSGASPTPLKEQAATLFRLTPPIPGGGPDTFWSVNKAGQLRAAIGGDSSENSVEAYLYGGLKLGIGGAFKFLLNGHLQIGTRSKSSIHLTAEEGMVRIFGGGSPTDASATIERLSGTGRGEGDLPAVDIEAATNVRIKAERKVTVKGNEVELDASAIALTGHESLALDGVRRTSITTEELQTTVNGKCSQSFSGPKYLLPTNAPLHERIYVPMYPGLVAERVLYAMGDREEFFLLGNHKTIMLIGNMLYATVVGTWTAVATTAALTLGAAGINGVAGTGVATLTATAGAASVTGLSAVSVMSAGPAMLRGGAGVYLGGPITGPDIGPILCAGSLEPFTNLPFGIWGLGAKGHIVGP